VSYLLVITDTKNTIVFKTSSWQDSWDGTKDGRPVPSGVYLWYLKITTPAGKKIQKSGTVTVIRNR
ncbi:MAG TPA: gliding motility-associated C-terminal domain-containing protein, partial [Bacteroidales bacterium]|nr:gliding motility-associated C-terminal domain-containing protein [Bacteroidales bacterium]